MRLDSRPLRRILVVVFCVAACGSPTAAPASTPSGAGSAGGASIGPIAATSTAEPTPPPSLEPPTEAPATEEAPTEEPPTAEPTLAPADTPDASSGPLSPAPSLDERVRVVSVETVDERTRDLMIETPSLPVPVGVRLLLPAGFETEPGRRWPVLYLLHGAGLDQDAFRAWTYNTDVQALVAPTNLLVVMPQGDPYGWYSDWWNGGNGGPPMWETFHLTELMALLERDWRASDQRAIAGFSMGGYGAMVYAAGHPGMFKATASFSGPLDILGEKDSLGNEPGTWGDPVEQLNVWKAHNPIDLAEALRGTTLYISYGGGGRGPLDTEPVRPDDVEAFRAIGNRAFVDRLAALGIPATVDAYGPGSHSWPYFERALHRSLPLLLKAVGEGG
jgi:S-formylglutathione hydrolase FrmB